MQTNLAILKNPFNINEREQKIVILEAPCSLQLFLERHAPISNEFEYHASINGRVIGADEIYKNTVVPGDFVAVCPVISGGGRGSNPLAILAGIALAVFSFGAVSPFVSGIFGGGTMGAIAGNIAAGLFMSVGGALISNAFAPKLESANAEINDENRYGWGSLQNITQQGAIMPITYGTIRTAGQVLNQNVDVDEENDDEYLYVLLSGGEGVIDKFSDVKINDNPISNYNNAEFWTRPGEYLQTPISGNAAGSSTATGFEQIYSTQSVNVNLQHGEERDTPGEWHVVELNGAANSIAVQLSFPQGLGYYKSDSAAIQKHHLVFEFEYRFMETEESSYSTWLPLTEYAAQTTSGGTPLTPIEAGDIGRNRNGVKVKAGTNDKVYGGWLIDAEEIGTKKSAFSRKLVKYISNDLYYKIQVRGRLYMAYNQTGKHTTYLETAQWVSVSSILDSNMSHPGQALVGIKIKATDQLNGGMPTITWRQTRNTVLVYDNGSWTYKDAQNPAWIIYDLCVRAKRIPSLTSGAPAKIQVFGEPPSRMDISAFKAWAAWNDRTLNNRPALKMNLYVDESKSLWQWCNDIAASARGAVVLRGTKISCIFDAPSNPVQLFSMGNIVGGSFSGEFLPVEDRATAVEISYNNEDNNFEREQITVYSEGYDDEDARQNPASVQLTGITDFERAYREGVYRLNQNKYILRTITFTADVEAIACQVGDVILVQHDIPQWGQGGRIIDVDRNTRTLTLDNEVILNSSRSYIILVRENDDGREQFAIKSGTSGTTNRIILTSAADLRDVNVGDVFALGELNKVAKPFRVQEMSRTGDLYITLTCSEYIEEIYTEADNIPVIQYSQPVNEITNLSIVATGYYTESGQWVPEIYATWGYLGERPASYQVSWKYDNGLWGRIQNVSDSVVQSPVMGDITYNVRVRAVYHSGLPSEWKYASQRGLSLKPTVTPNAPTNLRATGWFGYASLEWELEKNPDYDHIEIWEGTEDDLTKAVHIGNTPADSYTRLLPAGGAYWYWIRAVNHTGTASEYNSQAGTPCIVNVTDHETYITNLLQENPYLLDVIDEITDEIEPLQIQVQNITDVEIPAIRDIQIPELRTDIDAQISRLEGLQNLTIPEIEAQIHNNAEGIIQNAINHAIEADERREAVAEAKQELHAEITATNEAIAEYNLSLLAKIGDNTAAISDEATARANSDEALSERIDVVVAQSSDNAAAISSEITARANADSALGTRIDGLATRVGDNESAIQSEATTRSNADSALGTRIDGLVTRVGAAETAITTEQTTRANADSALGTRIDNIVTRVDGNAAAIQNEQSTRANSDTATAEQITILEAQIAKNAEAAMQNAVNQENEASNRRDAIAYATQKLEAEITAANEAIARARLELLAQIGDNQAAIVSEQTARANADSSMASDITTLQSTVGSHTTSIQTLNDVKDGVTARHYVKTDSNGYVSGYELYNGGSGSSAFTLAADKFLISRPGVKDPKQMFVYDSSSGLFSVPHIQVDSANIKNAIIETAHIKSGNITTPYVKTKATEVTYNCSTWNRKLSDITMYVKTVANTPVISIIGFSYKYLDARSQIGAGSDCLEISLEYKETSTIQSTVTLLAGLYGEVNEMNQTITSYTYTAQRDGYMSITPILNDIDWGYLGRITIMNQFHVALALYR